MTAAVPSLPMECPSMVPTSVPGHIYTDPELNPVITNPRPWYRFQFERLDHIFQSLPTIPSHILPHFQNLINRYHRHLLQDWQNATDPPESVPENHKSPPNINDWERALIYSVLVNYYEFLLRIRGNVKDGLQSNDEEAAVETALYAITGVDYMEDDLAARIESLEEGERRGMAGRRTWRARTRTWRGRRGTWHAGHVDNGEREGKGENEEDRINWEVSGSESEEEEKEECGCAGECDCNYDNEWEELVWQVEGWAPYGETGDGKKVFDD